MDKKQWYKLAIASFLLSMLFISLDMNNGFIPTPFGNPCKSYQIEQPLNKYDITCILGGEIYEPFIYLFSLLWVFFLILAWLEPKNMEDDAPKHLKDIVKLSRLEHEVKELKKKLKVK